MFPPNPSLSPPTPARYALGPPACAPLPLGTCHVPRSLTVPTHAWPPGRAPAWRLASLEVSEAGRACGAVRADAAAGAGAGAGQRRAAGGGAGHAYERAYSLADCPAVDDDEGDEEEEEAVDGDVDVPYWGPGLVRH